jgi:basic membrane protein A
MRKMICFNIRKRSALACLILFVLGGLMLAGCRQKNTAWKPGKPLPKEKIKIGVIQPNEINSNSFYDYAHYVGTMEMQKNIGLEDAQIIRKFKVYDDDPVAAEMAMRDCISEGANIIIAASWGYSDPCEKLAAEYPSVIFAHATGAKYNSLNFTNYTTRNYQARYLSGIAAGLKTKTGKVGFVAAMGKDNSEVTSGINAFAIGVNEANPDAGVYVRVTHSWYDPLGETEAANALIAAGCDVIAQHCNTAEPQTAAQRAGVWGIGFNSDMSADAPDAVICSVVINWGALYTRLVESIINATFSPTPHYYGLAEGAVDITPPEKRLSAPGTEAAVEKARRRILEENFNVFDGILETNNGGTVGEPGTTLSDEIILNSINWYYRTVIEL